MKLIPFSVKFDDDERHHLQRMAIAEGHGRISRYLKGLVRKDMADKGLTKILEFYEEQLHKLHPMEPVQRTSARRKR